MKNLFLTLLFLLCIPALVLGQSPRATRNLEKLQFDATNQLKTVSSGGGGGAVTNAGTFAVQEDGAALTALEKIDDMIAGTGANISQVGGIAISTNTGLRDAGTIRVTVSTNDLVPISAASLPLPAGAATSAKQLADGHNVVVTDLIPGTGATNLGKAIGNVVGATATGIALLGKHDSDIKHLATAEGEYDIVRLSDFGAVQTSPEQHHSFDDMNSVTGWAALGNDTLNLLTTKKHVVGTDALTFDKVNGDANTVIAGIEKTITTVDLADVSPHDLIQTTVYLPSLSNVDYIFARVGTNSSNYNEWRIEAADLTAATFLNIIFVVGDASHAGITGNGWDPTAISYLAVGVAFDLETRTLAGIIYDHVGFHTNQHTTSQLTAEVSSSVSTANINLQKIGGSAVDKGSGNCSNGCQRIALGATEDVTVQLEDADVAEANPLPIRLSDGTNFVDPAVLGTTTYSETVSKANVIGFVNKATIGTLVDTDNEFAPGQVNPDGLIRSTEGYPITEVAPFDLFDGSAETSISTTNLGASKAYALTGTGRIVKVCIAVSLGTPFGEDMSIIFFSADPSITIEDASLSVAAAELAEAVISLSADGFRDNFATVKLNCQDTRESFDSITHVVVASEGATTYDDEDIVMRLWYERKS